MMMMMMIWLTRWNAISLSIYSPVSNTPAVSPLSSKNHLPPNDKAPISELWGMLSTLPLPLLPCPLCPGVVEAVRIPSIFTRDFYYDYLCQVALLETIELCANNK